MAALGADIGVALTQGDSLRDMLRRCTETLVRHLDAAFARVWTINEADTVLELQASTKRRRDNSATARILLPR